MAIAGIGDELSPTIWTIAFLGRPAETWFDHLSPEWCRHVFAFGYVVPAQAWIVVDPQEPLHRVYLVPDEYMGAEMEGWKDAGARFLRIHQQPGSVYGARVGNWCSPVIARLVGLRSGALRPVALYRDLVRSGAYAVYEERHVDQNQGAGDQGRSQDRRAQGAG